MSILSFMARDHPRRGVMAGLVVIVARKTAPKAAAGTPQGCEVARLAETSPHLLEDIGFCRDAAASCPLHEVWTRGPLRIEVVARR